MPFLGAAAYVSSERLLTWRSGWASSGKLHESDQTGMDTSAATGGDMLVAGDSGGTNTRLAFYSADGDGRRPLVERDCHSGNYAGLEQVVRTFLTAEGLSATAAC